MIKYLIKHSSEELKEYIIKLIINNIGIHNIRLALVYIANMGASDSAIFEYEKLHDEYYSSLGGDPN